MDIPSDLLQRLNALEENPAQFDRLPKRVTRDADSLRSFLETYISNREKSVALFREWSPKLREFAVDCRAKGPKFGTLTADHHAQQRIYEDKIFKAERIRTRKFDIVVCSVPSLGIPLAQRLWPGADPNAVILTPDEIHHWWKSIYKHPEDACQWWIDYWWDINDSPDPRSPHNQGKDLNVPENERAWLVVSGLQWGPMHGGYATELWSWNGDEAKFIRKFGRVRF